MPTPEPLDPIVVDARFNGGALAVATEQLIHDPASTVVTIRGGATELALFLHEARALAHALTLAADHAAALAAEQRRAPGRESQERVAPRRMESVATNVAGPPDIGTPPERAT